MSKLPKFGFVASRVHRPDYREDNFLPSLEETKTNEHQQLATHIDVKFAQLEEKIEKFLSKDREIFVPELGTFLHDSSDPILDEVAISTENKRVTLREVWDTKPNGYWRNKCFKHMGIAIRELNTLLLLHKDRDILSDLAHVRSLLTYWGDND